MSEKNKHEKETRKMRILSIVIIIVGSLFAILAPFLFTRNGSISFLDKGPIGDTIGGTTAPIVGLVNAILVYFALRSQIRANEIVQEQRLDDKKNAVRQSFDQTFFNMLPLHHRIVEQLAFNKAKMRAHDDAVVTHSMSLVYSYLTNEPNSGNSRDVFRCSYFYLDYLLSFKVEDWDINDKENKEKAYSSIFPTTKLTVPNSTYHLLDPFNAVYLYVYEKFDADFGHYFRNLYRIIKMIDEQHFDDDKKVNHEIKYFYTSIVRSQLSDYEIQWLFFNGIYNYGHNFKPLLEKYSMLKILKRSADPTIIKYKEFYDSRAFDNKVKEK
ncbi:MAG TPA: putative phage abortive infection protein [Fluviicola sp.]|nr:putative phage abortive infection protein [Fluviicola sp.]